MIPTPIPADLAMNCDAAAGGAYLRKIRANDCIFVSLSSKRMFWFSSTQCGQPQSVFKNINGIYNNTEYLINHKCDAAFENTECVLPDQITRLQISSTKSSETSKRFSAISFDTEGSEYLQNQQVFPNSIGVLYDTARKLLC